jgi:hypothetical protein
MPLTYAEDRRWTDPLFRMYHKLSDRALFSELILNRDTPKEPKSWDQHSISVLAEKMFRHEIYGARKPYKCFRICLIWERKVVLFSEEISDDLWNRISFHRPNVMSRGLLYFKLLWVQRRGLKLDHDNFTSFLLIYSSFLFYLFVFQDNISISVERLDG